MTVARATRVYWFVGDQRVVAYGDGSHFAWKRTTKLGEALEGPHGPFDSIATAARAAARETAGV